VNQPRTGGAPPSVRAQLLATGHWSLLATRSTAQSEVLSRITTFLTLVSASIVSLALIRQLTRFDQRFPTFAPSPELGRRGQYPPRAACHLREAV
jgi:hypothetical protein